MAHLYLATSNARTTIAVENLLKRHAVHQLLKALNADGEEARLVGGAVRDSLMGRPVDDIDIATTALPEMVISRVNRQGWKAVPTGLEHGTVTAVIDGAPYEITTLRRDVATDGRHASVAFTRDFAEDAMRRDFTINAMSISMDGVIHDYSSGKEDARLGTIRFMGDAGTRIREDYLRILRFFRFNASHGVGEADISALTACEKNKAGLRQLSRERIRQEMLKLLPAYAAPDVVMLMQKSGIWQEILPNITIQPERLQSLVSLESVVPPELAVFASSPMRRLAVMLNAIEPEASVAFLTSLTDQLRLSRREEAQISAILSYAPRFKNRPDQTLFARTYLEVGAEPSIDTIMVGLAQAKADEAHQKAWLDIALAILERKPVMPFKTINFEEHGIPHGPVRGDIIRRATEIWIMAGLPQEKQRIKEILAEAMQD
jgi:poly(A) polymerase